MKKKGPTHEEIRQAARPDEWKPLPKVPKIPYEPPKPIRQTAPKRFSGADIERLKQKAAGKTAAPAHRAERYLTINLEEGMPLSDAALRRMETGVQGAFARGAKAVKFIHGYGSTGRGGTIKEGVRSRLPRTAHVIRVITGEEFPSCMLPRDIPELYSDPDRRKMNPGITIAILG